MNGHPQDTVGEIVKARGKQRESAMKQRLADSTTHVESTLPANVWSIKVPQVWLEGTELAHGTFEHVMFVMGSKLQARQIAKQITGLPENHPERPNWKVVRSAGEEYVVDASKFLSSRG